MNRKKQEKIIDNILNYMNDSIERNGSSIDLYKFNFVAIEIKEENTSKKVMHYEKDIKLFKEQYPKIKDDEIKSALRSCISRKLIEHAHPVSANKKIEFYEIILTEEGQGRAISNKINHKTIYEKILDFIINNLSSLITTILTSIVTTLITFYLTNLLTK